MITTFYGILSVGHIIKWKPKNCIFNVLFSFVIPFSKFNWYTVNSFAKVRSMVNFLPRKNIWLCADVQSSLCRLIIIGRGEEAKINQLKKFSLTQNESTVIFMLISLKFLFFTSFFPIFPSINGSVADDYIFPETKEFLKNK